MRCWHIILAVVCSFVLFGCQGGSDPNAQLPVLSPDVNIVPVLSTQPPEELIVRPTLTETTTPVPAFSAVPTASATTVAWTNTPPAPLLTPTQTLQDTGPPNIILIVVDSLRADHVSAYGYERETTPNMDQLVAEQGVVFKQAFSVASWTCPSNAALLSGKMPTTLNSSWATNTDALPDSVDTLAEHLKNAGYYTAGFVNNSCVQGPYGFAQGFDVYDDILVKRPGIHNNNKARANEMNNRSVHWLKENWQGSWRSEQPLFLFIYYMDPHLWYNPLPPFDTLYDPDYTGPVTPAVFGIGKDVMSGKLQLSERDNQHIQALYDGEIAYWDAFFRPLMESFHEIGVLDNSLVIITSDHGEAFNEHGTWTHGTSVYQEEIHVPLLMRYPGRIPAGLVVDAPVQSYDIMPTILAYAGLPIPDDVQAVNLKPLIENPSVNYRRSIFSEVDAAPYEGHWAYWQAPKDDLRAIQFGGWKYILHVENQVADELYQLNEMPPYEAENELQSQRTKAAELVDSLRTWFGIK